MGKKPFDKGLISGNAMWGKIVDRSGLGDYRMPITLNTELMGSPTFDAKTNEVTGEKPVENLEALQQALLEKARSGYKDYGERIYSDEPTPEMVKAFEEEKGMDGYETLKSGQGAFNEHQREWKVLIHPGDRPAYEQTGN